MGIISIIMSTAVMPAAGPVLFLRLKLPGRPVPAKVRLINAKLGPAPARQIAMMAQIMMATDIRTVRMPVAAAANNVLPVTAATFPRGALNRAAP
jgi:hypothetical protein